MKSILTIVLLGLAIWANGQSEAPLASDTINLPIVKIEEGNVKDTSYVESEIVHKYIFITNKYSNTYCPEIRPTTYFFKGIPVDMLVRHYFAISYWD